MKHELLAAGYDRPNDGAAVLDGLTEHFGIMLECLDPFPAGAEYVLCDVLKRPLTRLEKRLVRETEASARRIGVYVE